MKRALDVDNLINADAKATQIAEQWEEWNTYRRRWLEEKKELRDYLYATDTRTTSNSKLPWSNSTTTPKLTQIYDNLKANYTATLFPNSNWMRWIPVTPADATRAKRDAAQSYMDAKLKQSKFTQTVDTLIDDFIQTGNCFGTVEWANESYKISDQDDYVGGYVGPRIVRISPYDICFDPTAADFKHTPKIVRSIKTLGEVANEFEGSPELQEIFSRMLHNRSEVGSAAQTDKGQGFIADGFGSIENYYQSSYVEFLTFYGDIFDRHGVDLSDLDDEQPKPKRRSLDELARRRKHGKVEGLDARTRREQELRHVVQSAHSGKRPGITVLEVRYSSF